MVRICFVCHGNICRSPMAEFIMKYLSEKNGCTDSFSVESRATHDDEIIHGVGNPIYPPAQKKLRAEKIPFSDRQATQLRRSDYEKFDYFFCMDDENIRCINLIFGSDPEKKVHKLPVFTGTGTEVSDPWFTGDFDLAYADIYRGCEVLLSLLRGGRAL